MAKKKGKAMPYSLQRWFTCDTCKCPAPAEDLQNCEFCEAELCPKCCRYNYLRLAICLYCEETDEG